MQQRAQERNSQTELHTTENSPSTTYRFHQTMHSTATNKALATAPNEPPSLYQAARRSLTRRACRHEGVAHPNSLPRRWANQPPRSHDDSASQLPNNELTAPSVRSLAIVHASLTILRATSLRVLKTVLLHSFDGNPLQMTKLPRPYLKSGWLRVVALVQLSQWRLPGLPVNSVQGQRERLSALCTLLLSVAD